MTSPSTLSGEGLSAVPPGIGGSINGGTAGSVLFVGTGGVLAQDNDNFKYTNSSGRRLQIGSGSGADSGIIIGTYTAGSAGSIYWTGDTPNDSNYRLNFGSTSTALNAGGGVDIRVGGSSCLYVDSTQVLSAKPIIFNAQYLEATERTAPSAPAANGVRIYAQDNGGGKTQLMALFSSGAAQQIAIQP